MPFYTYILISESLQHLYIGQTNNLEQRLARHNQGHVKSTRIRGPWYMLFSIQHSSRAQAMKLERKLKNLKSRKRLLLWIQAHKDDQEAIVSPVFYEIWEQD
ncbi:MAG: GIY-YIG nuclease family protein [Bacteroidota bacterium]